MVDDKRSFQKKVTGLTRRMSMHRLALFTFMSREIVHDATNRLRAKCFRGEEGLRSFREAGGIRLLIDNFSKKWWMELGKVRQFILPEELTSMLVKVLSSNGSELLEIRDDIEREFHHRPDITEEHILEVIKRVPGVSKDYWEYLRSSSDIAFIIQCLGLGGLGSAVVEELVSREVTPKDLDVVKEKVADDFKKVPRSSRGQVLRWLYQQKVIGTKEAKTLMQSFDFHIDLDLESIAA